MNLAIHIPVWLLWTLGAVAVIPVLVLAFLGALFIWVFKDWSAYK